MADEGRHMISVSPVPLADVFGCSDKNLCELCLSRRLEIVVNLNTQMQDTETSGKLVGANFVEGRKQTQDSSDRI